MSESLSLGVHTESCHGIRHIGSTCSRLTQSLETSGITVTGYLSDPDLSRVIGKASLAILPYLATQGGSATFSSLASAAVPVVGSDIPEFQWLLEIGAGVELTERSASAMAEAASRILSNAPYRRNLASKQSRFAATYSWESFIRKLAEIVDRRAD